MSKEKKGLTKSAIREPKKTQKLEFCQSQRSRFDPLEAAPIQMDRSDGDGVKDGDADTGKNQVLSFLGYKEAVKKTWQQLKERKCSTKTETKFLLNDRYDVKWANFSDVGGNPQTRLKFKAPNSKFPVFVEGNWITETSFATGYPTQGLMRNSYWYCMEKLLEEGREVIIVNLMAAKDVIPYGNFLPGKSELTVGKEGLCVNFKTNWEQTLTLKKVEEPEEWKVMTIQVGQKGEVCAFQYDQWEDYSAAKVDVVAKLIKGVYEEKKKGHNPVIVCNCRAGIGRTGTFLTAFYFYEQMKKGIRDLNVYSLENIQEQLGAFREARGDNGFVQREAQFIMLCDLIKTLHNEVFGEV